MSDIASNQQKENKSSRSILDLPNNEVRKFLLKAESYCSVDLPPYIIFEDLLKAVDRKLGGKELKSFFTQITKVDDSGKPELYSNGKEKKTTDTPKNYYEVNYTILNNKDGMYAWRPFSLIHPALYISLVHHITKEDHWKHICDKFEEFSKNDNIQCLSLPVVLSGEEKDKAKQVSHWWKKIEQKSIELSLEYEYLIETDITDCYGSIYTHSIAWALHTKDIAKKKRQNNKLIGNIIDNHIQDMCHGQTNGIPQGSVLMDFVAELVLGYADSELVKKIREHEFEDYKILRYRDDYRIFINNPQVGENIIKLLTEVLIDLGLKLKPSKTKLSKEVIRASIKADKLSWMGRKQTDNKIQNHLLIIHDHSTQFPNSGSLVVALDEYQKKISNCKKCDQPYPLISIVVDIAYRNPRTYPYCSAILSKLLSFIGSKKEKQAVIEKIKKKFDQIPNTGHMQIWLQRITLPFAKEIAFDESICRLIAGENVSIWNNDWISSEDLKKAINPKKIVDREKIDEITPIIPVGEVELFIKDY